VPCRKSKSWLSLLWPLFWRALLTRLQEEAAEAEVVAAVAAEFRMPWVAGPILAAVAVHTSAVVDISVAALAWAVARTSAVRPISAARAAVSAHSLFTAIRTGLPAAAQH
jgi:hypothetical protein